MSWNQELVWVARNERNEIIRAQDQSPQDAIKAAEDIHKKVMSKDDDTRTGS